jgi:hypothetical protein
MTLLAPAEVRTPVASRSPRRASLRVPTAAAALAVLGWLPFLGSPTKPDEGGYLLVASQWGHGRSVYGNYWVDRPPLLLAVHALAAATGGVLALRLIALAGVVAAVFLAHAIAVHATAGPGSTGRASAGTATVLAPVLAAVFLTTPLFGTAQVDGELLCVPVVLAGLLAYLRACSAGTRREVVVWATAAGGAAAAAALVKQNALDVFVFAAVLTLLLHRRGDRRRARGAAAVFLVSAVATVLVVLGLAALRGTGPAGLWDSVVVFRFQAGSVLRRTLATDGPAQLWQLVSSWTFSCAPLVLLALAWRCRRRWIEPAGAPGRTPDLRWPAAALVGWELVVVVAGGGFWLHYLLVTVPGTVVLAAAAAQRPGGPRRVAVLAVAAAAVSAVVATTASALASPGATPDQLVSSYLRAHALPGDTAMTAFGHPDMLWDAHLLSPYAYLWRLPVLVRDPALTTLRGLLVSPDAPTWVVVAGRSLSVGQGATPAADAALAARYHVVAQRGSYYVWHRDRAAP